VRLRHVSVKPRSLEVDGGSAVVPSTATREGSESERRASGLSVDRLRAAGASVVLAALLVGASAAAALWAVEAAVTSSQHSARTNDVRDVLRRARDLLDHRQQAAAAAAASLAASPRVERAFANRDDTVLAEIARTHPGVGFVLWDGRVLGRPEVPGLAGALAVYAHGKLAGRVVVAAPPDPPLLARARTASPDTQLAATVKGKVVAASPPAPGRTLGQLAHDTVGDDVALNSSTTQPAHLFGFRTRPSLPAQGLWPWLAGILAAVAAFLVFERRERARRPEPRPGTVRDAVALVGETLAATHNPDALMPVILQAAIEVTNAAGGVIAVDDTTLASRGDVGAEGVDSFDVTLEVLEGRPATMTLYASTVGFNEDARDAAEWIAAQAVIALENARLHSLVQRQAVTDELTGLANRRRFLAQLELEITRSRRSHAPLGIVLADLDDFKRVNDTWGHDVGDDALRAFAEVLRASVRDVDLPVRLGGEEFAVLLPDTNLAGASQLAERIRRALETTAIETRDGRIKLTASFGVSCFPTAADAAEDLLNDADQRLYEAKRRGKNRVVVSQTGGS
jgi:diguanylate cyclase (GGDEF)-like protein